MIYSSKCVNIEKGFIVLDNNQAVPNEYGYFVFSEKEINQVRDFKKNIIKRQFNDDEIKKVKCEGIQCLKDLII